MARQQACWRWWRLAGSAVPSAQIRGVVYKGAIAVNIKLSGTILALFGLIISGCKTTEPGILSQQPNAQSAKTGTGFDVKQYKLGNVSVFAEDNFSYWQNDTGCETISDYRGVSRSWPPGIPNYFGYMREGARNVRVRIIERIYKGQHRNRGRKTMRIQRQKKNLSYLLFADSTH